jgi:hypothetical protein
MPLTLFKGFDISAILLREGRSQFLLMNKRANAIRPYR